MAQQLLDKTRRQSDSTQMEVDVPQSGTTNRVQGGNSTITIDQLGISFLGRHFPWNTEVITSTESGVGVCLQFHHYCFLDSLFSGIL